MVLEMVDKGFFLLEAFERASKVIESARVKDPWDWYGKTSPGIIPHKVRMSFECGTKDYRIREAHGVSSLQDRF